MRCIVDPEGYEKEKKRIGRDMLAIGDRYTVHRDEIWGTFVDYVVCIKPDVDPKKLEEAASIYDDDSDCWSVQFMEGEFLGAKQSPKIYTPSLETAFKTVNLYSEQKKFDSLMDKLVKGSSHYKEPEEKCSKN